LIDYYARQENIKDLTSNKREEVQARPFREKGYTYGITMNLRRHSKIDIPGQRQIETSRDVVLEEEIAFQKIQRISDGD
jgi:hypothetical protein